MPLRSQRRRTRVHGGAGRARGARADPRVGPGGRAAQSLRHRRRGAAAPAAARVGRGRAGGVSGRWWRCRRCSRRRPTWRSRSSGSRCTTSRIPTATCASRWSPTCPTRPPSTRPGDDEILAAARAGIARLNARHGPAPGGGARFFVLHRRRLWNAERARLDRMGAQARQAARAEPAAARRDATRPSCPPADGAPRPAGVRYVVTLDADTRLPIGRGRAPRRDDGASAQPAAARSARRSGWSRATRVLQPRVTAPLPGRGGLASSSGCSRARRGSIRTRRPSPTCTRTSSARARTPARGSTTSTPSRRRSPGRVPDEHAAEPRPVRGALRARRPGDRRRAVRERAGELPVRRGAPAPLGARRLAAAAVDPARALLGRSTAGRWSTICGARSPCRRRSSRCWLGWMLAGRVARALDGVRRSRSSRSRRCSPRSPASGRAWRGSPSAATSARSRATSGGALDQIAPHAHDHREPGVADGARDRCARSGGSA